MVTWYIVGIPTKTNFEHFISLLLIIGGLFRAMAQMKACNFLDPHQNTYWILNQNFGSNRPKIWHSIFKCTPRLWNYCDLGSLRRQSWFHNPTMYNCRTFLYLHSTYHTTGKSNSEASPIEPFWLDVETISSLSMNTIICHFKIDILRLGRPTHISRYL